MNRINDKSNFDVFEAQEWFSEHEMAKNLGKKHCRGKEKTFKRKEKKMMIQKNQVFEGTLVAAGWDKLDDVNQSSLYTQDGEDILLEHNAGMKKFTPLLNQKVRIRGDIISTSRDGRRVLVTKINRLLDGFTKPKFPPRNEFDNLLPPKVA